MPAVHGIVAKATDINDSQRYVLYYPLSGVVLDEEKFCVRQVIIDNLYRRCIRDDPAHRKEV